MVALPAEHAEWRASAEEVIRLSRPALDLENEDDVRFVLMFDNASWDDEVLRHYHPPGCRCGGPEAAEANWIRVIDVLHGGGCPLALLARWKGVEQASAYLWRGLKHHKLQYRTMTAVYTQKTIEDAESAQNAALRRGDVDFKAARTVKAGKVLTFMRANKDGRHLHHAMLLNCPAQHYLNRLFATDKKLNELTAKLQCSPANVPDVLTEWPFTDELEEQCRAANMKFLNGEYFDDLACEYSAFFWDLDHERWNIGEWKRNDVFQACQNIAGCLGACYFRLRHLLDIGQDQLLVACSTPFESDTLERKLAPLEEKRASCPNCVGSFCEYWLPKLMDVNTRRSAHGRLLAIGPFLPLISVIAEKKHTLGQQIHREKATGRAVSPLVLALRTYRKAVRNLHEAKEKLVFGDTSQSGGKHAKADWTKIVSGVSVAARAQRLGVPVQKRRQNKKSDAFSHFRRVNWTSGVRPGPDAASAEHRRLLAAWQAASEAEKVVYQLKADQQNAAVEHALGTKQFGERDFDRGIESANAQKRAKQRSAVLALGAMVRSPSWKGAAQVESFGQALRPALVDTTSTGSAIRAAAEKTFGYNSNEAANPTKNPRTERTCPVAHAGMCQNDETLPSVSTLVYNLYLQLRFAKTQLPVLLGIGAAGIPERRTMLAFGFGKGQMYVTIAMERLLLDGDCAVYKPVRVQVRGRPCVVLSSLHLFFRRALLDIAAARDCLPTDVDELDANVYTFCDAGLREWAVGPALAFATTLAATVRGKCPRRDVGASASMPFGLSFVPDAAAVRAAKLDDIAVSEASSTCAAGDSPCQSPFSAGDSDVEEDEPPPPPPIAPPPAAPPPLPPPTDAPPSIASARRERGIVDYERAKTARASCFVCGKTIARGSWKMHFQVKASSSLRDCKSMHGDRECVSKLPMDTRDKDFALVSSWSLTPGLPLDSQGFVDRCATWLNPSAASASSSSATAST